MKKQHDKKEKKAKRSMRGWIIGGSLILILVIAVNVTLTGYLSSLMDAYFGGDVQIKTGSGGSYEADADANTKETALAKATALVETI